MCIRDSARLCRLPLGVHRLKSTREHAAWWRFLAPREAAQEALLDAESAPRALRAAASTHPRRHAAEEAPPRLVQR